MKRARQPEEKQKTELKIVELCGVPKELLLSEVIRELWNDFTSITTIYRCVDLKKQLKSDSIFIFLWKTSEAKKLIATRRISMAGNAIKIKIHPVFHCSVMTPENFLALPPADIEGYPVNVRLSNLRPFSYETSLYLGNLVEKMEENDGIIGLSLLYSIAKHEVRKFGFATFMNRESAINASGKSISVFNDNIECQLGQTVPLILSDSHRSVLTISNGRMNEALARANWLNRKEDETGGEAEVMEDLTLSESEESDNESTISLDVDYDFDDECNIVKRRCL